MPTPDPINGAPCWIDLMTSDAEKAKNFYGELFGWTFETGDQEKYGGYITASKNGRRVAGLMQKQEDQAGMPDLWTTYLRSEDAAASAQAAAAHGGRIYMEPMDIPEQGRMAMFGDASGAAVGIWEPREMTGFELTAEPGSAVWHELLAKDYDEAVAFYRDVFAWDTHVLSDSPEFRYTTLGAEENAKAGIMDAAGFLPDGAPSTWVVYFGVDHTNDAVERAVSMGASIVQPAEDSPHGRNATLTDPTGALFKIIG